MNFEGKLVGKDLKIAIVVSRFNDFITTRLLEGAKDTLIRHEVEDTNIDVAYVPGAFEIPLVAKKLAQKSHLKKPYLEHDQAKSLLLELQKSPEYLKYRLL